MKVDVKPIERCPIIDCKAAARGGRTHEGYGHEFISSAKGGIAGLSKPLSKRFFVSIRRDRMKD